MSNENLKKGDKVKIINKKTGVVLEGKVDYDTVGNYLNIFVDGCEKSNTFYRREWKIEKIIAFPTKPGSVIKFDETGNVYTKTEGGSWIDYRLRRYYKTEDFNKNLTFTILHEPS